MTGICGWLGQVTTDHSVHNNVSEDVINMMSLRLIRGDHDRERVSHIRKYAQSNFGLGVLPAEAGNGLAQSEGLFAVLHGNCRWTDKALAELASREGDAPAMIQGYRQYGIDVLKKMKGPFSLAIIDANENEALIAIDRMAIQTLAYGIGTGGQFVFGTVTDSVKSFPDMKSTLSTQAIYNYLANYVVPAPTAIYDEQQKLLPGEYVYFQKGRVQKGFYWRMPYTSARHGDEREWIDRLKQTMDKSFLTSVEGVDVDKVGSFLSGGLDSSTVSGLMKKHTGGGKTFTIGFHEPRYDESSYARLAADHFNTDHHEYFVQPEDVLWAAPKIAEIYDEPYGNTSAVPALFCAKMAKDHGVDVMLAGDGGDEIFAGNERYVMMKRIELYGMIPESLRKYALEPFLKFPGVNKFPVADKAYKLMNRYAIPMPDRIYSYEYRADVTADTLFPSETVNDIDVHMPRAILREVYGRADADNMVQKMMFLDLQNALANNDLRKVNRMCQIAGVDVRYPMLEEELVEFSATIPSEVMLPGLKLRHFFKQAMSDFLPNQIITKEKHGFGLPFVKWVGENKALNEMVMDHLNMFAKRGILRTDFIKAVQDDCRAKDHKGLRVMGWDIAMLEMWMQAHYKGQ